MPDLNAIDIEGAMRPGRGHGPLDGHRGRRLNQIATDVLAASRGRTSPAEPGDPREPEGGDMTKHGKKSRRRGEAVRPERLHAPAEAFELVKSPVDPQVRRDASRSRSGSASIPARPTRCCAARSRCPHGTGKDVRVAVFAAGDAARDAEAAGADVVGADDLVDADREGLPRLRRRDRDAGPDGSGRQARSRARPARPHAEPEDRHGHHRRRQGGRRSSRAARSSTAPTATATCTSRSARSASEAPALLRELPRRARRAEAGEAGVGEGQYLKGDRDVVDDGPGREDRPVRHPPRRAVRATA